MKHNLVDDGMIYSVGYDSDSRTAEILFRRSDGREHFIVATGCRYFDVDPATIAGILYPSETHQNMAGKPSSGVAFNRTLRQSHRARNEHFVYLEESEIWSIANRRVAKSAQADGPPVEFRFLPTDDETIHGFIGEREVAA